MWDLPRPGLEPVSPALAGRFSTTAPPGKLRCTFLEETLQPLFYKMRKLKLKEAKQLVEVCRISVISDLAGILAQVCLNPMPLVLSIMFS